MRKISRSLLGLALLLCASSAYAQNAPKVDQTATKSVCANIVALGGSKVDCSNLTAAQMKLLKQIHAVVMRLMAGQIDATKLEEWIRANSQPQQTQDCQGSICNQGSPVEAPQTVNNFGPPPSMIEGFEIVPSDPKTDAKGHPITSFRFYVSKVIADQKFIAICDRPCSALGADTLPKRTTAFGSDVQTGGWEDRPAMVGWIINYPIHAEEYQTFTVVSKDTEPVNITRFAFGNFPVKPQ